MDTVSYMILTYVMSTSRGQGIQMGFTMDERYTHMHCSSTIHNVNSHWKVILYLLSHIAVQVMLTVLDT